MDYAIKVVSYVLLTVATLLLACLVLAVPSLLAGLALWLLWNYFLSAFVTTGIATAVAFLDCWAAAFLVGVFVRSINLHKEINERVKNAKENKGE